MLRKFLIVCVCVCCIMAVFNINKELSYDTVKTALEDISDSSYFIQENFAKIGMLQDFIPDYLSIDSEHKQGFYKLTDPTKDRYEIWYQYRRIIDNGLEDKDLPCVWVDSETGEIVTYPPGSDKCTLTENYILEKSVVYSFTSEESRDKIYDQMKPFMSAPHRDFESIGVINAVVDVFNNFSYLMFVGLLIIEILLGVLFGFIVVCWDLVVAVLRIVGFIR